MELVVLSNRRTRYLPDTLENIRSLVTGWTHLTIVDDSGDEDFRWYLRETNCDASIVSLADSPAGYGHAMEAATAAMHGSHAAFWEEDFLALEPINLTHIADVLTERPHLAQVALLRQPWFANEVTHGGVIEALEAEGARFTIRDGLLEHDAFFTGNPAVWSRAAFETGWPRGSWSENRKRDELRHRGYRFGMIPGVKVQHVGERTGFGY